MTSCDVVTNFLISFFAGVLFYLIFTLIPSFYKKIKFNNYKKRLIVRLSFNLSYFIIEGILNCKDSNITYLNKVLYKKFINNKKIRNVFIKYQIKEVDCNNFFKEINNPKSMRKDYYNAIQEIEQIIEKHKLFIIDIDKNDFKEIIKNIKNDSEVNILKEIPNFYFKLYEFLIIHRNSIYSICEKLLNNYLYLTTKEMNIISEIYDHKFLRLWSNHPEATFNNGYSIQLSYFFDEIYNLYKLSILLEKHIKLKIGENNKKYQELLNL